MTPETDAPVLRKPELVCPAGSLRALQLAVQAGADAVYLGLKDATNARNFATGRRPLVLVGDGAFQMTGWELGNAQRYGWDPIVLVFNNAGWEMLRAFEPAARFNDLSTWDFAAMAAGMGGDGHRVRTRAELKSALQRAQATRGRFQLLDIRLARGARSPTLERFVNAVKRLSIPTPSPTPSPSPSQLPTEARRP